MFLLKSVISIFHHVNKSPGYTGRVLADKMSNYDLFLLVWGPLVSLDHQQRHEERGGSPRSTAFFRPLLIPPCFGFNNAFPCLCMQISLLVQICYLVLPLDVVSGNFWRTWPATWRRWLWTCVKGKGCELKGRMTVCYFPATFPLITNCFQEIVQLMLVLPEWADQEVNFNQLFKFKLKWPWAWGTLSFDVVSSKVSCKEVIKLVQPEFTSISSKYFLSRDSCTFQVNSKASLL